MTINARSVVVTGATSMIGHYLLQRLIEAGYEVHAVSRQTHREIAGEVEGAGLIWHVADISNPRQFPRIEAMALIHLGPLWLLPPLLPMLRTLGISRVIGFGSTSLFSKANSAALCERELADRLARAEAAISQACDAAGIRWTIFRPTLIYDCARDKNITVIARFIKRYGCFPLAGKAVGLRQPVHADDLAAACVTSLGQAATFGKAYNLSGGETLEYRQMVGRIFVAQGKVPRLVPIPLWLFQAAIRVISTLPGRRGLTAEMATRMNADLCFGHPEATNDFGYSPRPFLPVGKH